MGKLLAERLETLTLPSSTDEDPSTVTVNLTITARQAVQISEVENKTDAIVDLIAGAIKSWNFTDDDGSDAPITRETVDRLPLEDFIFIANKMTDTISATVSAKNVGEDEKKD